MEIIIVLDTCSLAFLILLFQESFDIFLECAVSRYQISKTAKKDVFLTKESSFSFVSFSYFIIQAVDLLSD